jgi:5-methylcytosine-specific restriction endonuclease McrA
MKKYTAKKTSGSMSGGKWIRPEKRLAIYLRDEFHCVYCGSNLHNADPFDITLDHIKCRSAGGNNSEMNLITACRSCNSSRGDKTIAEYADASTRKAIKRQTRRKLTKYLKLAKALIEDK